MSRHDTGSALPGRTALQAALDAALGTAAPALPAAPVAPPPTRATVRAAALALAQRNRLRQRSTAGQASARPGQAVQTGQSNPAGTAGKKTTARQAGKDGLPDPSTSGAQGNHAHHGSPGPSNPAAGAPPRPRRRSAPAARAPVQQRATDLQALGALAHELRVRQALERAREQALREAAARRAAEQQLFARSVGPVTPLRDANLAPPQALASEPLPLQLWLDEERALLESISDDFDVSTLLDTDDQLSFRRPGIGREITQRLRAGHWSIQRQLDLHGLRIDEAREALGKFIRQAHKTGMRCVRVVHGKGLGSPGKAPVLKGRVQRWLVQKNEVLAFVQARPMDGGAGALVVLLQPVDLPGSRLRSPGSGGAA